MPILRQFYDKMPNSQFVLHPNRFNIIRPTIKFPIVNGPNPVDLHTSVNFLAVYRSYMLLLTYVNDFDYPILNKPGYG